MVKQTVYQIIVKKSNILPIQKWINKKFHEGEPKLYEDNLEDDGNSLYKLKFNNALIAQMVGIRYGERS
jgi:hypothetical protein